jgi:predicted TIM-barrel fold metal-dependent hydrolase
MNATLVSADDHVDLCYIPPTMWQERVSARFRDAAPKVAQTPKGPFWMREGKPWGNAGSRSADGRKVVFDMTGVPEQPEPGVWRPTAPKYRLQDMDADGIAAQIIYNFLDWSFDDQALKTECLAAYNSWLAEEFCPAAPNRLIGLATLPAHDPQAAAAELERAARLGLKGAIFDVFSATLSIADPAWDRLWGVAAETGIPVSVHVGGGFHSAHRHIHEVPWGRAAAAGLFSMQLDEILSLVLMCGMLERHPKLKMVMGESGIGWIPYVLERIEFEIQNYAPMYPELLKRKGPRELFHRQVYATFTDEILGTRMIPEIGVENVLWAADYPHGDGSYPKSREVVERQFKGFSAADRAKITGDNARRIYGIPPLV